MKDGRVISVESHQYDTVLSVKESLATRTGLYPSQQRLIYAGKILANEMTLGYYGIRTGAQLYFLPVAPTSGQRVRPYELPNKLITLLNELPNADSRRYTDIVREIRAILKNRTVRASARIDPDISDLLEDAEETLATSERPQSGRMKKCLAQVRDQALDTYDCSISGLNAMKALIDDDSDQPEEPQRTNLRYKKTISNQPLPTPWSTPKSKYSVFQTSALGLSQPTTLRSSAELSARHVSFDSRGCGTEKGKFAQQLAALKNMGFNDEEIILEALVQTNGNVQLAAKLLGNSEMCQ
jgi:hypothetical protein